MSAGNPSPPGAFPEVVGWSALTYSALVGGSASSTFTSSWGIEAIASSEIEDSLFKSLLKCSAQRTQMSLLSVSKTGLSEEQIGTEPVALGP